MRNSPPDQPWHQLEADVILKHLGSSPQGLSDAEAQMRLSQQGSNQLLRTQPPQVWRLILQQIMAPLVLLLLGAVLVSLALGDFQEAVAILLIVVLNTALGVSQDYRSEKAMAALRELVTPVVTVRRDHQWQERPASELVQGDIVHLESGQFVPADLRLLWVTHLQLQEAALTGEAEPVHKHPRKLDRPDLPLGDRHNLAYSGTIVLYGSGEGVVIATGMQTQLGQISGLLQSIHSEPTPLQQQLAQLGQALVLGSLALVAVIVGLGMLRNEDLALLFLTGISIAVAAIPEGLPAVLTIALALGSQRLLSHQVLIRKLTAVETLGTVTTICTDKTGTLTENRMRVTDLEVAGQHLGWPEAATLSRGQPSAVPSASMLREQQPELELLLLAGVLCNDVLCSATSGTDPVSGDPTEVALVQAAAQFGLWKPQLDAAWPRLDQIPFDAQRRRMTTLHRYPLDPMIQAPFPQASEAEAQAIALTKGALESLLPICSQILLEGEICPLTADRRHGIVQRQNAMAQSGARVLAIAFQWVSTDFLSAEAEQDLVYLGLVGLRDPIRPEVPRAIQTCREAGIRPVMITGDHPLTALHIARSLGLSVDGPILTGVDLAQISPQDLSTQVGQVSVYARVTPEDKLKIVDALQQQGQIVAMTGDGINDAPALKQANIGIAMGIMGTDVAKEAADMALLNDNFATIVIAVQEGRVIYDNLRKFMQYLLSSNAGEIWVMLLAPLLGMPLPLLPLQILWINLMTDGLPALALGLEPPEPEIMRRPPLAATEPFLSPGLGVSILWIGLLMGGVSLGAGYGFWHQDQQSWQTLLFTVLTLSQLGNALALRSQRASFFSLDCRSNPLLLASIVLTLLLQIAVIYVPFLQAIFSTTPLTGQELLLCFGLSSIVFWGVEISKWNQRWRS
ncbi:cation-translocating P-type ATPase [Lyngbya confervoides]|uniref:Cation-translocating P-type ATPase n=1 Tax=Lyngbya confervoides BDU141951 TaxID=1574623 RepID=A0ABD4T3I6_9CYAN|nr:cation-translocating P-type ATPase [Lyngbya confervoides]MCM1983092.1 cation-translocating P-type ATPase [Lyngbya confervoides BDU141951]